MKILQLFVFTTFLLCGYSHRTPYRAFAQRPLPGNVDASDDKIIYDPLQDNLDFDQPRSEILGLQNAYPEIEAENSDGDEGSTYVLKIDLDPEY